MNAARRLAKRVEAEARTQQALAHMEKRLVLTREAADLFQAAHSQFVMAQQNLNSVAAGILAQHGVTSAQGARLENHPKRPVLVYLPGPTTPNGNGQAAP